jgi:hypothetical protein
MAIRKITSKQWVEAIAILTLMPTTGKRELPHHLQKQLRDQLRGPFAKGMSREQAVKIIDSIGWRISNG